MCFSVNVASDVINYWDYLWKFLKPKKIRLVTMSFWNDVHKRTIIFVHEIDWKQNQVAPDWFKFVFSTVLIQ